MDPGSGSTLFASILNSSVMLCSYLQQTTSVDDIFRCIFFLGALRVNCLLTGVEQANLCLYVISLAAIELSYWSRR